MCSARVVGGESTASPCSSNHANEAVMDNASDLGDGSPATLGKTRLAGVSDVQASAIAFGNSLIVVSQNNGGVLENLAICCPRATG